MTKNISSQPPSASQVQAALLEADILTGTSADPGILRLLPPFTLAAEHVAMLAQALSDLDL